MFARAYYWLFALLVDPFDLYNQRLRPSEWPLYELGDNVFWTVLAALVLWTALLTYHDLRVSKPRAALVGDMPLSRVFSHLRPKDYLEEIRVTDEDGWAKDTGIWELVGGHIKDAASQGRLQLWGRPRSERAFHAPPLEPIPPEYWRRANFTYDFLMIDAPNNVQCTFPEPGVVAFHDVRVNAKQLKAIWPRPFSDKQLGMTDEQIKASRIAKRRARKWNTK